MVVLRRRREDVNRTFVCSECASEQARLYAGTDFDFTSVLARVDPKAAAHLPAYGCRFCGATLADIIADGRPGCCSCYARFAGEIEQAVQTAQGSTHHTGKAPAR
jgi:protein-arginine kinase activator protein McsA